METPLLCWSLGCSWRRRPTSALLTEATPLVKGARAVIGVRPAKCRPIALLLCDGQPLPAGGKDKLREFVARSRD